MPRRYTDTPFPAYRYVPGRTPHPVRDPRGHAHGVGLAFQALDPSRWLHNAAYLHAIDLFNHGFYWEAHEWLEPLWAEVGRRSATGVFLQGLIQCSAALLKHRMEQPAPARRLCARASDKLRSRPAGFLGFDGPDLAARLQAHLAGAEPEAPRIHLDEDAFEA